MRKLLSVLFSTLQGRVRGGLLFVALLATTCLWAQRFQVGDLYYQVVNNNDNNNDEMVIPHVNNPGYGRTTVVLYIPENTPAGCYAVGTVNGWGEKNTDLMFTPVEGATSERWVACTFDYAEDMQIKVLALPSDPTIAPNWSYQWGKNCDPENDLEEDNVVVLEGSSAYEIELENQGQPKLKGLADNGVVYIHVKAWATTPIFEAVPCETAAFKHPFGGGDWVYREATKTADATFELNALYGNTGVNVALNVNAEGENWYPEDQIEFVGDVAQGDYVNFKFVSEKGTFVGRMIVTLIEKGTAPENPETPETPGEAKDITVKAKVPAAWTNTITAWVWPTGGYGKEVTPTKEGDWYVYTEYCAELNIIFKNGEGWTGDANQTIDITGIKENTCLVLESDGDNKATYTYVDCDNPWYMPSKKSPTVSQKRASTNSHPQVVVTYQPESSDNYAYLSTAYIPETVVYKGKTYEVVGIDEYAFANSPITSITIPNSVTSIGNGAFNGCKSLTSITIPNSVTKIGRGAFENCSSLTELSIPSNCVFEGIWEDDGSLLYWGYTIIVGCHNLKKLIVPASLFDMHEEDYLYVKSDYLPYCPEQLESLIINSGELSRLGWDFIERNNKTLKTIDLGETTSAAIAEKAFYDCYKLENLSLPSQLEHIPYMAVAECVKLKSISIPATVVEIEDRAFENCRMLSSVAFAENGALTRIGNWAFYNNHELTNLVIPEGVTEVGHAAFYGCTYLAEMTLPSTVQEIADNGFALCAKLQRMNVDALIPPTVAARTFEEVDRSIPVYVPDEVVDIYKAAPVWQEFNVQGKSNDPAAVGDIQSSTTSIQKLLRGGQLLILRDGKMYSIMGQEL